jgi:small subunit ribosomal protein S6
MRRYELMLLLRPDLEDDKLQAAVEKVTRAIVNGGGSLSKVSPWGKRRLAYDIGQHREASYFLIHFDIEPSQVREIERGMLITEEILRHLVTVLEDRGMADEELAPAATPRGDDPGLPDDLETDGAETSDPLAIEPVAAEPVAAGPAVAEPVLAEDAEDEPVDDGTPADDAGEEPAEEERAAG